ncbi:hypothetical protein QBC46DRAFT_95497 [Diplogelasinospora grovesii]|uniref:Uncharacterized protein n=1 Tax=Diplogelasinospora grovesii TaxID=303347 RepID=A0AAN6NL61_9PEZI|nr:hypothetical protein QBC46DRAFT_95497 [Diplogelasinospora grovesii]
MARDRESDTSGTNQSKRSSMSHLDSDSQVSDQHTSQHHAPHHHAHRAKGSKHVVAGGGRLHARNPSSKALHKHHASTASAKLNRRQGSPSPERGPTHTSAHRRATSDLKLTGADDEPSTVSLKKNPSQSSIKRNRSHVEVGKKTRSATNLKRTASNPIVNKLKSGGVGGSKVHFKLGDEDQDADEDGEQEDEWVDASTSASPLLSRRGSGINPGQTANNNRAMTASTDSSRAQSPSVHHTETNGGRAGAHAEASRETSHHNKQLTNRILQRTPSHGAPPIMVTENVEVLPPSSRPQSPESGHSHYALTLSGTPRKPSHYDVRPGSSGRAELTSRFVGQNSHESGSGIPGGSFLNSANHAGILARLANGQATEGDAPRRPLSMGNLAQAKGPNRDARRGSRQASIEDSELTDEEDGENGTLAARVNARRQGAGGVYAAPREMNRTQQKLNLQRASSTLEGTAPLPSIGMGLAGVAAAAGPLVGGSGYDARDPRTSRLLERTGMEYLVMRRYQNPISRSIQRLDHLPGEGKRRMASSRPGTSHSRRDSDLHEDGPRRPGTPSGRSIRESQGRDLGVAAMMNATTQSAAAANSRASRPTTPQPRQGPFSSIKSYHSGSPGGDTDDGDGASRGMHEEDHGEGGQRLSGSSLVDGYDDPGTIALLRNLWDKNMDLSASQE